MNSFIVEEKQEIPVYAEADVLVVGGGPAGLCAAVSAARCGAKTVLMERYGYLGGMATGGFVLLLDCLCDGKGNLVIKGQVEEIIERLRKVDGIIEPPKEVWGSDNVNEILKWRRYGATGGEDKIVRYSPVLDPEMMKCVANDMVRQAGVQPVLHAWFSKAYVEDGAVKGAIFDSKSGRQAILAKTTIDCTGDGDVFASAGEDYRIGNLPLGLVFRVGNVDCERAEKFLEDPATGKKINDDLKALGGIRGGYSFGELPQGFYMRSSIDNVVWFNNTTAGSAIDIKDLAKVEIETRDAMLKTLDYFRKNVPGFEKAVVMDTSPQLGTRCSRMLDGEYIITRKELHAGAHYDDRVVVAQPPYRQFNVDDPLKEIPYRCFLPKGVDNLLVAGRCLSASHEAMGTARIMGAVMGQGQAVGTAAAMAAKAGVLPREIDVPALQKALVDAGALI